MPSICGYTWPDWLDTIIHEEAARAGVPLDIAYALIAAESGFDPTARRRTPTEDSVGLLQLNRIGGQGQGYSVEELMDPRRNLQIGLPYIRAAFVASWSPTITPYDFIWLVSTRSGHPGDVPRDDYRIRRIATIWACFFPAAGISGPLGAPSTVTGPGPAVALASGIGVLFAPGLPVPPASITYSMHIGSLPLILAIARLLGIQRTLTSLGVRTLIRRQLYALSPAGIKHRFISAIDPREAARRAFKLPYIYAARRLPPRHRLPRH